jgi:hypothetical protein
MLRRTNLSKFMASAMLRFSVGESSQRHNPDEHGQPAAPLEKTEFPAQPMTLTNDTFSPPDAWMKSPVLGKLIDQSFPVYDDVITGQSRLYWQEPAKCWHRIEGDDVLLMEEHDKEEWNDRPYVGVNHLYEPPLGSEMRPQRVEGTGNPGDYVVVNCIGNCAPHVQASPYYMQFKGYRVNKCPMCQQHFYLHNRPWLVMHPDWTDEPAADEGPAYTFAEIEAEFDRDFHEFAIFINGE